jgi:hypothetical protein
MQPAASQITASKSKVGWHDHEGSVIQVLHVSGGLVTADVS